MKINAIQNQGYMSSRKYNEKRIAFQGFDTTRVKEIMKEYLNYYKSHGEANEVIEEGDEIFKTLQSFDEATFNLHDYEKSFMGYKKNAFDEFISELGDTANDLPVYIDPNDDKDGMIRYDLPDNCKLKHIRHGQEPTLFPDEIFVTMDTFDPEDILKGINERSEWENFAYNHDEMIGKSEYFVNYPKSVDAIKKFIIDCIDKFILTPRAKTLEQEARRERLSNL